MRNLYKLVWYHNWSSWYIAAKNEESWEKTEGDSLTFPKNSHGYVILSHSLICTHMQDTQKWINQIHSCKELLFWNCVIPAPKIMSHSNEIHFHLLKSVWNIYIYYAFQIKIPNHWRTRNKLTELFCFYLNYCKLISCS